MLNDNGNNARIYLYIHVSAMNSARYWCRLSLRDVRVYFCVLRDSRVIESWGKRERERERKMHEFLSSARKFTSTAPEIRSNFRFATTNTRLRGIRSGYVLINVSPASLVARFVIDLDSGDFNHY